MDVRSKQPTPVEQPLAQLSADLQAFLKQFPPDMLEKMKQMVQREGLKGVQAFLRRMTEVIGEQAKAAELMRLVLEEQRLLETLRKLKLQDIEQAQELVKSANQHLEQADLRNMKLAQAVAVAVVATAFLPVALSGPRLQPEASDERSAATNHLQRMRDLAT